MWSNIKYGIIYLAVIALILLLTPSTAIRAQGDSDILKVMRNANISNLDVNEGLDVGEMVNDGWVYFNNNWYYYDSDKRKKVGWLNDKGKSYYLDGEGIMQTGWQSLDGHWYHFRPSGSMAIGWQLLADKWYYLENSGQMTTGWQFIGSHWYYFRSSGSMRIGWISDNNKWYFMDINGRMKTGWLEMNNKWYYLTDSGRMCTDWIKLKGKWYYLRSSGAMSVGWELINSKWYYLKSNGDMAYSQWINGKYYVGEDGAMYENCWTPDGYYVGNSGVWIRAKGRVSIQAGQKLIKDPGEISVLVNKTYILAPSYVPTNLITPDVPLATSKGSNMLRKEAAEALEKLFKAGSDNGYILYARSGYRSYSTQKYIFQSNVNKRGSIEKANRTSAKAGQSEHQTGLAMDITTKKLGYKLVTSFGNSAEGKWIAKNAHKYGFIVRYPKGKESITGYVYEPWHLRYLGEGLAAEVYKSGLTYEEYLGTFP